MSIRNAKRDVAKLRIMASMYHEGKKWEEIRAFMPMLSDERFETFRTIILKAGQCMVNKARN